MFALEYVLDGKKTENLIGRGVGIRMSWVEKMRKINKRGGRGWGGEGGGTSISDLRVSVYI